MKKLLLTLICIIAIFILLFYPDNISQGVQQGIKLNLYSVIPALLPFMILTNIMIKYNLCEYISYIFKPILNKIFKLTSMGCFAVIMGFTCGFPMGAKIIGDLYADSMISKKQGCYLVTFCNNCSITFLLNYIFYSCLSPELSKQTVLFLVYTPAILTGIINVFLIKPDDFEPPNNYCKTSVLNPVVSTIKSISVLSVYIICFTVISHRLATMNNIPSVIKCLLATIMEITSGANYVSNATLDGRLKNYLILACTVSGGMCIMFQSFEQLSEKSFKKYYLLGKLEQLIIFSLLYGICVL